MFTVDLNSDLGESFGAYRIGMDEDVIPHITSANIACAFHAGDPVVMDRTVALAKAAGIAIGAHPGFPDLMGFGRRNITCSPKEIKAYISYQIGALSAFAKAHGMSLQHCKPHGALYNMAAKDPDAAQAIADAVAETDGELILLALAGSRMIEAGERAGLRTASEVFADRAYRADGTLVPRSEAGSVIHDTGEAISRTVRMIKEGKVTAITGEDIDIRADSVCVHGDNPSAVEFVKAIRKELAAMGIRLAPLSRVLAET